MRPSGPSVQVMLPHLSVLYSISYSITRHFIAVAVDQFATYKKEPVRTVFPYTQWSPVFFLRKKIENIFMIDFKARYADVEFHLEIKYSELNDLE